MPLIKKASKKAFEHNIKAEMSAGKPQAQSLAIAYDVKRRNRKARGGMIEADRADVDHHELEKGKTPSIKDAVEKDPMDKPHMLKPGMDEMDHADADHYEKSKGMPLPKAPSEKMRQYSDDTIDMHQRSLGEHKMVPMQHQRERDAMPHEMPLRPGMDEMGHMDVDSEDDMEMSMVDRIMAKRMAKGGMAHYAKGGMIDLQDEEAEHANAYYPINEHEVVGKRMGTDLDDVHNDGSEMHGMDEDYSSPEDESDTGGDHVMDVMDHIDRIMGRMKSSRRSGR